MNIISFHEKDLNEFQELVKHLLTTENPEVTITIDDAEFHLESHNARAYACGIQTVLKALGRG